MKLVSRDREFGLREFIFVPKREGWLVFIPPPKVGRLLVFEFVSNPPKKGGLFVAVPPHGEDELLAFVVPPNRGGLFVFEGVVPPPNRDGLLDMIRKCRRRSTLQ